MTAEKPAKSAKVPRQSIQPETIPENPTVETARRRIPYEYPALLISIALAMLSLLQFFQNQKWLILLCCVLSAVISGIALFRKKKPENLSLFLVVYGVYLFWLGLGVLWACTGKIFLREYSKQLYSLPLVLFIILLLPRRESAVRMLLFCISAIGALFAFFSIDNASLGLTNGLLYLIPGLETAETGYEAGTRLIGVFNNANIMAGLLAICIFLSLYLLTSAENRRQRIFAAVFAAFQANTFLLNFSLGATGFFLVSVIIYLVFAGRHRASVFLRMLEIALPVLITVFFSFRYFSADGGRTVIPLLASVINAAVVVLLELALYPRLEQLVSGRKKSAAAVTVIALLLICIYAAAGILLRGDASLSAGETIRRSCYPAAGDYTLELSADGAVRVRIISQNEQEVVMHTQTVLYSGVVDGASFTVPEGSRVVYLTFVSERGATLHTAVLKGTEEISLHLGYPLLPGFIANRLQGLLANENAIQRVAFFRDGMKVFRDYPIIGAGLGSFETLLFGYQEFYYETKYVHNHYIQMLLDCGIIGFIIYLAMLLLTVIALWRGRRNDDDALCRLHPALCASFVMIVLHSFMEVVMSVSVYLPCALAIMALSSVCYPSFSLRKPADRVASALPGAVALVYAVLIALNLSADNAVRKSTNSAVRFFTSLEYASKVDAFEKNDWMISYLNTCAELESNNYKAKSDLYASKLMHVPSNSLHQHLISYYLAFHEHDKALEAAKTGVGYNYSNSVYWNDCFTCFAYAQSKHPEDSDVILRCVLELNNELQNYEKRLMAPIELNSISKTIIAAAQNE